jgi:hypothetical protein
VISVLRGIFRPLVVSNSAETRKGDAERPTQKTVDEACAECRSEAFEKWNRKRPHLVDFHPPQKAVLGPLLMAEARVPCFPDNTKAPLMLLQDLLNEKHKETKVYGHIADAKSVTITALYATSGGGKTRSLYEYLAHNFGVYLVVDKTLNFGSNDLISLLDILSDKLTFLDDVQQGGVEATSVKNLAIVRRWLATLLYVRQYVFEVVNEELCASHNGEGLTPHEWLLLQLNPEYFLGQDVFLTLIRHCRNVADPASATPALATKAGRHSRDVVFVDEAQQLLGLLPGYFVSSKGNQEKRSAYAAVAKGLSALAHSGMSPFPLFSGTGLSISALKSESSSVVGKELTHNVARAYFDLPTLGIADVEAYLKRILKLDGTDVAILRHVCSWLRGRPRWTATFLSVYLRCSCLDELTSPEKRLHEALGRYINLLTTDRPMCKRDSWKLGQGASALSAVQRFWKTHANADGQEFACVIRDQVLGGQTAIVTVGAALLIEGGLAAVHGVYFEKGEVFCKVHEPLILEAARNCTGMPTLVERAMRERSSDSSALGTCFEVLAVDAIRAKFDAIGESQVGAALGVETFKVPTKSSYGVLALKCTKVAETLSWLEDAVASPFEGTVPPFCLPDVNFGPDIVFLRWNDNHDDFRPVFAQVKLKSKTQASKREVQVGAMLTIVPSLLYYEKRGTSKSKPARGVANNNKELWKAVRTKLLDMDTSSLSGASASTSTSASVPTRKRPVTRLMLQCVIDAPSVAAEGLVHFDDSAIEERCSQSSCKKLHDTIVTIDKNNYAEFFGASANLLDNLLSPPVENNHGPLRGKLFPNE